MTIALGIDTGGTYTDAVLVDQSTGTVMAGAKALTTYHDLSVGIGEAVAAAFDGQAVSPADVELVGLSTTLATNAIVEGRGSSVCLMLIGYDPALIQQYGFERDLVTQDVVYLRGGHDGEGNETEPLDEAAAREAILARRDRVESFAVSGYFGVRNPVHELRVRALVEELTASADGQPLPVTCGHELTSRLNSVRRATTAALNARLIPLLRELIATVRRTLDERGVAAPLMVVKGDGSLVRAEWAMRRPIETILSGPAASVVGAWHLAGRRDVWVVDVGGTTTDIAALRDGRPRLNPEGAQVGEWRTMVEAVDAHTIGLGGDSLVGLDAEGRLAIGPRRVVPLCLLASTHDGFVDQLRWQVQARQREGLAAQFALLQQRTAPGLSEEDRTLLDHLSAGPQSLTALVDTLRYGSLAMRRIERLEARRLILRAGFTPTDALHVLGRFECWDAEASRIGAELLAERAGLSPQAFCEWVVSDVSDRVSTALVSKVLGDEATLPDWERETSAAALLARALGQVLASDLDCQLTLRHPVVAVGAPVEAYLPRVARQLSTELIITPRADVANAVGAVAGSVVQRLQVAIRPLDGSQRFRLHLPDGVHDFGSLEESVAYAHQVVPDRLRTLAHQAGADQVEMRTNRVDHNAPVRAAWGQEIYLGTQLTFTAVGRPRPARGA
ncbi:MAG TPA: hydantoinase/oxoprolinase family protein [Anaerolineae bacterium]|nr:hydantoinase/oxoprolinase family protein [Anaerolineae bacterium]